MVLRKITGIFASCALLAMAIFVGWQVFTRYLTAGGSVATEESVRLALVILTFMGGAYCFATEQHIAIDLFERRRGAAQRSFVRQFLSLVYGVLLTVGMMTLAWQQREQRLAALQLSMAWVYGTAALAGLLSTYFLLKKLFQRAGDAR